MSLRAALTLAAAVMVVVAATELARRLLLRSRLAHRFPSACAVLRRCLAPMFATAAVLGAKLGLVGSALPGRTGRPVGHALAILLICAVTWLAVQAAYAVTDLALAHMERAVAATDNRRARRLRTQLVLVRRFVAAAAVLLAAGAILTSFGRVRAFGASLLASAGIIGVVGGIAARASLGSVFAGLQLTFSDALRMDDVVVVEQEWGRIEEITLTYVVVRTWDERRLILPTTYFTETPFQNWTRQGSRLIGAVHLRVDWTVPVDALRAELRRVLEASPLWDRRVWVLQVTDVTDSGFVELRALMSAADASSAWSLRCEAREALVTYLRDHYPDALPRARAELAGPPPPASLWTTAGTADRSG